MAPYPLGSWGVGNLTLELIDFHAHLDSSPERLDQLFQAQDLADIGTTVVVAGNLLEPASLGDFLRGGTTVLNYEPNNEYLLRIAKENKGKIIPFFTIDPSYHIEADIEQAVELGYLGFKFNPLVHKVDFGADVLKGIYAVLDSHSMPLYTHITLNPASSIEALAGLAQNYKNINFVIGHMGYATADQLALSLAEHRPNVYLETSVGSVLAFKCANERGLSQKLIFGSEFPAHEPFIEFEKLKLTFSTHDLNLIGRDNAYSILGI